MAVDATALQDDCLAEIVRRLVEALSPERIYLFGSRARGEAAEESDYDVLVVVVQKSERPYQLEQEAYGALWGVDAAVDVVMVSRDYFERYGKVVASLPGAVAREGKLLYAA